MATSPSQFDAQIDQPPSSSESESQFSSVVYGLYVTTGPDGNDKHAQDDKVASVLELSSEIDQNSAGIVEEMDKCKISVLEKKKVLEEEKEQFQKAAYAVLEMLNNRE
ncbi:hypothetical protein JRO89_XS03G0265700 [Xanthoceras sorbifolium]|uniref:Uncharacterized protein n=1 Tax=Xanthoceras sorbifolium TaxID=99658 RepID=A0ABQ8IC79_9ROSI|nr:hypothetical protein JRO89_XS03G0265700 [Xanthoceras sorbifolium]